jgi:3-oxoacyl-[acyl-carrier-protein] synthase II
MPRRVVITSAGAVTPLGASLADTADALSRGATGVREATVFDASGFSCRQAAEVRDWDPRPLFRTPKALKITDRPARFAVAAARMTLSSAGWPDDDPRLESLGVAIGSCGSDLQARDLGRALAGDDDARRVNRIDVFADRVLRGLNPLWLLVSLPNMTSAQVAIQTQARGPNTTIMSDWAAGLQAIGEAAEWIRAGEAEAVLAGGADSAVQPFAYAAYEQAQWLATPTSDGFVPGEAAAVVLLEGRDPGAAGDGQPLAEVRAYAAAPRLDRALCEALREAGWRAEDVSTWRVAVPPAPHFTEMVRHIVPAAAGLASARLHFERRLGFPLAAAAPLDVALLVHGGLRDRTIAAALGSSGEAVVVALETAALT